MSEHYLFLFALLAVWVLALRNLWRADCFRHLNGITAIYKEPRPGFNITVTKNEAPRRGRGASAGRRKSKKKKSLSVVVYHIDNTDCLTLTYHPISFTFKYDAPWLGLLLWPG